ncbi:MAG: dihydroorotase [Ignavibacteriales bacterium]
MNADILIKNGKVVTPNGILETSILVNDGRISGLGSQTDGITAKKHIDAKGRYIIPGLVDPHMHFGLRNPKDVINAIKEEWEPETCGAIYGGVTTILVMLCSKDEYTPMLRELRDWAKTKSYSNYGFTAVIQNKKHIEEIQTLFEIGVRGFKHFFTAFKGIEGEKIGLNCCEEELLCESFEKIAQIGSSAVAMIHAEDSGIYNYYIDKIKESGQDGLKAWADARPNFCEYLRVEFAARLALEFNLPLHFVHISTKESLEIIKKYKKLGANISAEMVPHTIAVPYEKNDEIGVWGKFVPPLRSQKEIEELWKGIKDGTIEHISSDHCCYTREEKEKGGGKFGSIWNPPPGISNVMEHWLPVLVTYGVKEGKIDIQGLVKICCENNAKRFGLFPRKGCIAPGSDADLVILDIDKPYVVDEKFYHGRNKDISIHFGETLYGRPQTLIVNGETVIEEGELLRGPNGMFVQCF